MWGARRCPGWWRSLSAGGPVVRRDSLFRIASITKPVTGAATLALVRDGLLDLDEPVGRLLPELAAPRVLRRMDGPLDATVPARRPMLAQPRTALGPLAVLQRGPARDRLRPRYRGVRGPYEQPG